MPKLFIQRTYWALLIAILSTGPAMSQTNEFVGLRGQMSAARESVILLLSQDNIKKQDYRKILKDRTDAVTTRLARMSTPPEKSAQYKELSQTWKDYVLTYERDFIPAIDRVDTDDARRLVTSLQRKRFARMQQLLQELGAR